MLSVRHRIDGLEKHYQMLQDNRAVRHRIDGLEIIACPFHRRE